MIYVSGRNHNRIHEIPASAKAIQNGYFQPNSPANPEAKGLKIGPNVLPCP
jgi:hypothetical protein